MVYRRTVTIKKTTARRRVGQKAVAKRVVKAALARTMERKRKVIKPLDQQINGTVYYLYNPLVDVAIGTGQDQRVGTKMNNVRLELSLQYNHEGLPFGTTTDLSWQGSRLRVLVIKSRHQLAAPAWTAQIVGGGVFDKVFAEPYQGSISPVNRHDYTVLMDRSVTSVKNFYTGYPSMGTPGVLKFSVLLAKSWQYSDINSTFGKGNNIYVLVTSSNPGAVDTDRMGRLQTSGYLTWTDA